MQKIAPWTRNGAASIRAGGLFGCPAAAFGRLQGPNTPQPLSEACAVVEVHARPVAEGRDTASRHIFDYYVAAS
jgi:hypothetical protein